MTQKKSKRKVAKSKAAPKRSPSKRRKPAGRACRNANMTVTRRKRDHAKALAKIKSLKKQTRLAEKSATRKKNEVLNAQKRAKLLCSAR